MNQVAARQIVVASVASTVVIVIVSEAAEGKRPDMRTLVGLSFAFLFLSVLADFAPQVAGPLSVVVLLTSLVVPAPGMRESAGAIFLRSLKGGGKSAPNMADPYYNPQAQGPPVPGFPRGAGA